MGRSKIDLEKENNYMVRRLLDNPYLLLNAHVKRIVSYRDKLRVGIKKQKDLYDMNWVLMRLMERYNLQ